MTFHPNGTIGNVPPGVPADQRTLNICELHRATRPGHTYTQKKLEGAHLEKEGEHTLELELCDCPAHSPSLAGAGEAAGAGAFLTLRCRSACPFYGAITESIKHPFETPWTSADMQTVVR